MRDIRAAARIMGRRTTLRYLTIGVGASLLAACKGNDDAKGGTKGGTGGSGSSGEGGSTGGGGSTSGGEAQASPSVSASVADKALAAFVRGRWGVRTEMPDESSFSCTATIDDGTWTLDFGDGKTTRGTWALQGGRLALQVPEDLGGDGPGDMEEAAAENVPASVGDSLSLFLPWQPPGFPGVSDDQRLDVNYSGKNGVLRIRHMESSGMTIHTCTRL